MLKNPRFVVIVLGVAAVVSSVAGYFYGAGAWPAKVEDAPPTLRSGPPALWTQGGAFITPLGARRQLRGVALPPGAGPDDVRAALAPGVSAVGVVVEPDAYRDDPDLRQRVDEAVTVAAEAGVYPVVSAAGPAGGGACGDGDTDGTEFWSAIAENLGGRPWIVYDLGASGCTDDWDRQRLLAASAADAIRVHAPEALVIVPAPEGMTAPLLAAAPVERQGIGYRILGAEPNPTGPAPLRVMSDLPLVLELPDLPAAGDRTLTARTAVSDLVAAGAAGWFLPADAVGPLSDAVSKAFSGAARTERGDGLPRLHADGARLADALERPVRLFGVNRPGMEVSAKLADAPSQKDIERIAASGANLLRLPVNPQWYRTLPEYRRRTLDIVAWAEAAGMYTMLDLHWSTPQGESICMPDMNLATRFLQEAAFDLRGVSSVIYDVYNEPCKTTWAVWRPIAERFIDVVRTVEPDALAAVSGLDWSYDFRGAGDDPVQRDNLLYSAHDYPWKMYLDREKAYGFLADRYPVMITEFGADFQPRFGFYQDPVEFTRALFDFVERRGLVGWAAWAWHPDFAPKMFTGATQEPTAFGAVVLERLAARLHVAPPEPRANAGDADGAAELPEAPGAE